MQLLVSDSKKLKIADGKKLAQKDCGCCTCQPPSWNFVTVNQKCRSASHSVGKCGVDTFIETDPPRKYRTMYRTGSGSSSLNCSTGCSNFTFSTSSWWMLKNACTPCNTGPGICWNLSHNDDFGDFCGEEGAPDFCGSNFESHTDGGYDIGQPAFEGVSCDDFNEFEGSEGTHCTHNPPLIGLPFPYCGFSISETTKLCTWSGSDSSPDASWAGSESWTLSDEFFTGELFAEINVPAMPECFACECAPDDDLEPNQNQGCNCYAYQDLDANEVHLTQQDFEYKFTFESQPAPTTISWALRSSHWTGNQNGDGELIQTDSVYSTVVSPGQTETGSSFVEHPDFAGNRTGEIDLVLAQTPRFTFSPDTEKIYVFYTERTFGPAELFPPYGIISNVERVLHFVAKDVGQPIAGLNYTFIDGPPIFPTHVQVGSGTSAYAPQTAIVNVRYSKHSLSPRLAPDSLCDPSVNDCTYQYLC